MTFELKNLRFLERKDLKRIPKSYVDETDMETEDDKSLRDQDYLIGDLVAKNDQGEELTYTIVHGFPGDNADGIIFGQSKNILAYIGEGCRDVNPFTHWYLSLGEKINDIFCKSEEDDPRECPKCQDFFVSASPNCPHIGKHCPTCDGESIYVLRCNCVGCLFSGTLEWEEQWDSLGEILSGIALGAFKLGVTHKRARMAKIPLQTEDKDIKALYDLYEAGYDA